ncbi:MAG: hypothetical protein WAZ40_03830 [Minisyncoccia bacterium]
MPPVNFSQIAFPPSIMVTDQEIDISALSENQKRYYVDLFNALTAFYTSQEKPRVIVGIAGPAGSGKSVIASIFKMIARQVSLPFTVETVGIDGFHYPNEFLLSKMSEGKPLKDHKGRFDTYEVQKLTESLRRFSLGERVSFPAYSRKIHDPVPDAFFVEQYEPTLLVIEGLWLLREEDGWNKVGAHLDFRIFIETNKEHIKEDLIKRHLRGGRNLADATTYYEENESKNYDLIVQTRNKADKIIPTFYQE